MTLTDQGNSGLTWERRLALWLPRPIFFAAFLIAAALTAAYLSFQWFFAFPVDRITLLMTLMIAFILMVIRYYALGTLGPQPHPLEVPPFDRDQSEVRALQLPRDAIRRSRLAGAAGVVLFAGVVEVILVSEGEELVIPWIQLHDKSATMALSLLMGWFMGRSGYFEFFMPTSHRRLPQQTDIDLLDLEHVYAMGRGGLRRALVWFVGLSIGSLFFLDTGLGLWGVLFFFATAFGIGLGVLLRPAREVRGLIRNVKRDEMARLEPRVRQARDDALHGDVSTQGRLTDLLAYQDRVQSTPEWPFDSSTLLRFGLYLLIPVGSMVGGALVERVIDMMLD